MKPIKLGIVGLGRAGWGMHTRQIAAVNGLFEVVACCDILPERNQKAIDKYNCRTYSSIEELVKDEEVEIVDIATRNCDHYKHALLALEHGKDVLLEKPMTINFDQAFDLFRRANKPGLPKLYVRQQRRFEGMFTAVMDVVKSGKLGKIYEINIEQNGYQHRDDWQTLSEFGGGQLLNWGPHIIDHSLQLLQNPVKTIISETKQIIAGGDCEDHLNITLKDDYGRTVNMCISGATALKKGRHFEVYGDRGAAVTNGNDLIIKYIDQSVEVPPTISDPGTPGAAFGKTGTYANAIDETLKWVEEKVTPSTDDELVIFWEYLYKSYREGQPFPIKEGEVLDIMKTITTVKEQNKK